MAPRQAAQEIFNDGYKAKLQNNDLLRYESLLQLCDGVDPFQLDWKALSNDINLLPAVNLVHITHYLVYGVKSHTMVQMKAYKATQAFSFLVDGWVQGIKCHPLATNKTIVLGKIKHSQRLNEPPARAWVLMEKDGTILAGWCSCIAGPGEACSHVGAVCYAVELGACKRDSLSCTSKANAWLPPSLRDVPFIPIKEYDLSTPEAKRKRMLRDAAGVSADPDGPVVARREMTQREKDMILKPQQVEEFLGKVKLTDPDCALLRVSREHSEVPTREDDGLPPALNTLYDEKNSALSYEELVTVCENKFEEIKVTEEESLKIRMATINQSKVKKWYTVRSGRVNASKTHALLHTDLSKPSISLIKSICYPEESKIYSVHTEYGKKMEPIARRKYTEEMQETHGNFKLKEVGYFVAPEYPYLGASPDGVVQCDCCGKGLVEIKTRRTRDSNETEQSHMYQMQQQMLVTSTLCKMDTIYCDYVIYREDSPLYVRRVYPDPLIQQEIIREGKLRFICILLPELLGKYFSALKNLMDTTSTTAVACYCMGPVRMPMAKCSNRDCTFTYFHLSCVNITRNRKDWKGWLCPECSQRQLAAPHP